jgi:hypothetical protein
MAVQAAGGATVAELESVVEMALVHCDNLKVGFAPSAGTR